MRTMDEPCKEAKVVPGTEPAAMLHLTPESHAEAGRINLPPGNGFCAWPQNRDSLTDHQENLCAEQWREGDFPERP